MFKEMILSAQLLCVTEAVYYEARGEDIEGMKEVAAVVHNRVIDSNGSHDYCDIIGQPAQFSYLRGRKPGTLPMRDVESESIARRIAREIIGTPSYVMGRVKYFHRYDMKPSDWNFALLERVRRTGDHILYRDR